MARTISSNLETEMDSLTRHPAGSVTVEPWLPDWTAKIEGLSFGKAEQYAHGHDSAVYGTEVLAGSAGLLGIAPEFEMGGGAASTGEDSILIRARSGVTANPQNGALYIAVIKDADLNDPTTWDSLWSASGITGLMHPAWTSDAPSPGLGGSIAVVAWDNAGTPYGRVFYTKANGNLCHCDVNLSTKAIGGETVIASLGSGWQLASMQIASCAYDEVFALSQEEVEASQAAWHKAMFGTLVKRFAYSGGWSLDTYTFPFHTSMSGGAIGDMLDYDAVSTDTVAQWGKRPCGGLGAINLDGDTAFVAFGAVHWRRRGPHTHSASVRSFIYHRDSGWWEEGPEIDGGDFTDGARHKLPMFVRCSQGDKNVIVWSRLFEPINQEQRDDSLNVPRNREVVYAQVSDDGKSFTFFEYLGDQDNLTCASVVKIGEKGKVYALGWKSVYESPLAASLCDVDNPTNLDAYVSKLEVSQNNRMGMKVGVHFKNNAPIYDGTVKGGMLLRAMYGNASEQIQVGQGLIDQMNPGIEAKKGQSPARANAQADKKLRECAAEGLLDLYANRRVRIAPTDPVKHISEQSGVWQIEPMIWPEEHFTGVYTPLEGELALCLKSFPFAQTGADLLQDLRGTWFKDHVKIGITPRVSGSIEASVRFGDPVNLANYSFDYGGTTIYATISRTTGLITQIKWGTSPAGSEISTAAQSACAVGLLCHSPEVGRKYFFVWEANSNFSASSHTNDTFTGEDFDHATYTVVGVNRLYLLMSDYAGADWITLDVATCPATGLTVGHPADLKMMIWGGTIYCFYRPHSTGTRNPYKYAFEHKTGRFGASPLGIFARSHGGLTWQAFEDAELSIAQTINEVNVWDIKASDGEIDRPMEELLGKRCWQGWTRASFDSKTYEASRYMPSGSRYNYLVPVTNPCIDFGLSIPTSGHEAGVYLRGISPSSPIDDCVTIGLVAHATPNASGTDTYYYVVKRRYASGAEVLTARDYSPIPVQFEPAKSVPVRISVRGSIYSVWLAGQFAGHFIDDTSLGVYYGLYSTGATATFSSIRVPELFEVPLFSPLKPDWTVDTALRRVLSGRRIKAIYRWDGTLKWSYYEDHEGELTFEDNLKRSERRLTNRPISVVRVEGAYTRAEYPDTDLLQTVGRHFRMVHNPDIHHHEACYQEARMIVQENAELQEQTTFTGKPDVRVEPEDIVEIIVSDQGIAGEYIVDDIKTIYSLDEKKNEATFSTRVSVA